MTSLSGVLTAFRAFHILLLFLSVQTIPLVIPIPELEVDDMVVSADNLNLQKNHRHHKSHFRSFFNVSSKFGFNKQDSNSTFSQDIDKWLDELEREIEAAFNNTSKFKGFEDSFFDSSESTSSSESENGDAEKTNDAYAENI